MALWTWDGIRWRKAPWHEGRWPRPQLAVVWGCGESLRTVMAPDGAFNIVQNHGWQLVHPDLWVGMDTPAMFSSPDGEHNSAGDWPKVYRGVYAELPSGLPDGRKARDIPLAHFADLAVGDRMSEDFFPNRGQEQKFMCGKARDAQNTGISTMHVAIQVALWMGFKRLGFAGIDLNKATSYAFRDKSDKWTLKQIIKVNQLLNEEFRWFRWFVPAAVKRGIECVCLAPESRLKELMPCQG